MPKTLFTPGMPLTQSGADQLERDSATVADLAAQWQSAPTGEVIVPAKLTAVSSPAGSDPRQYAWTEQWWNADTFGTRKDRTGGQSGTTTKDSAYFPYEDGPTATEFAALTSFPQVFLRRALRISETKGWRWEVISKVAAATKTPLIIAHLECHFPNDTQLFVSGSMAYKPNESNPANAVLVSLTDGITGLPFGGGMVPGAADGIFSGTFSALNPSGFLIAQATDSVDATRVSTKELIYFDAKPPQLCFDSVTVYTPFGSPAGWVLSGQVFNQWRGGSNGMPINITSPDAGAPGLPGTTVCGPFGAWSFTIGPLTPASYAAAQGKHITVTATNNYGLCDSAQRVLP